MMNGAVLPDWKIKNECHIDPFADGVPRPGIISYGLSHFGYDLRLGNSFKIFDPTRGICVDPKNFNPELLRSIDDIPDNESVILPGNSFCLGVSKEYIKIPENCLALIIGKSTYARCGIITNFTPAEPGWEGYLTIEISNTSPCPAKIYAGHGIAQIIFFRGEGRPETTYATKDSRKYQGQTGITLPKVD